MDEIFELVTLIQTKKITQIPIVLYGKDFWTPMLQFMQKKMIKEYKTISKEDLDIIHLVDSVDEAYKYITKHVDPCTPRQV